MKCPTNRNIIIINLIFALLFWFLVENFSRPLFSPSKWIKMLEDFITVSSVLSSNKIGEEQIFLELETRALQIFVFRMCSVCYLNI